MSILNRELSSSELCAHDLVDWSNSAMPCVGDLVVADHSPLLGTDEETYGVVTRLDMGYDQSDREPKGIPMWYVMWADNSRFGRSMKHFSEDWLAAGVVRVIR